MESENLKSAKIKEGLRFLVTGGICFLVEFGLLVLLKECFSLDTLLATPLAFLVSVTLNYILCLLWVFQGKKANGKAEKLGFLLTSVMGLGLNELLMLLFRLLFGEEQLLFTLFSLPVSMYMVNKCLATLVVLVWNYLTKRRILTKGIGRQS